MSNKADVRDSNSLPSWIFDHLGEKSYMEDEVIRLPSSLMKDLSSPESSPSAIFPPVEREVNIMTLEDLEQLRESCSIPSSIQIRLPEEGETIMSARLSEVAFYEADFYVGLQLPIHPSIRMILHFYNICPAQLIPNVWRSVGCAVVLWRYHKVALSLIEFINLFGLYKNPKPNFGWLYFRVRPKRTLFRKYPSNVTGWKRIFFFISEDNWEFSEGLSREAEASRVPRLWGLLGKRCNKVPTLHKEDFLDNILSSVEGGNLYLVKVFLDSNTFRKSFGLLSKPMTLGGGDKGEDVLIDRTTSVVGSKGEKVRDPILDLGLLSSSSRSKSRMESKSDLGLPPSLDQMKHPRKDSITSSSKKGKGAESPKGKEAVLPPEAKKLAKPRDATSTRATPILKPMEGTLANLEKVDRLTLDQVATKLFHVIRQAIDELTKMKNDRDATTDRLAKSEILVAELRESVAHSKKLVVEEFNDFQGVMKATTSKYFSERFDFCKWQLHHHHSDLTIDLEGVGLDHDLLEEEEEEKQEKEKEDKKGGEGE
ncbi:hypothetical protein Acr_21g0002490 [Actinidia rufa]|uniref:Transposase (putative) gypsy type domain-containing protein n=1 Tax=Actinidia rufa TaxID=165716 RepID=A0A7J0GFQ6_9ERIC|nr:hypothetical protein Acr_21g0002490 [Actinidia rufa]